MPFIFVLNSASATHIFLIGTPSVISNNFVNPLCIFIILAKTQKELSNNFVIQELCKNDLANLMIWQVSFAYGK